MDSVTKMPNYRLLDVAARASERPSFLLALKTYEVKATNDDLKRLVTFENEFRAAFTEQHKVTNNAQAATDATLKLTAQAGELGLVTYVNAQDPCGQTDKLAGLEPAGLYLARFVRKSTIGTSEEEASPQASITSTAYWSIP